MNRIQEKNVMLGVMISFTDKHIFGAFRPQSNLIDAALLQMIKEDVLDIVDGSIHMENMKKNKLNQIGKRHLWSYIYYLWLHNSSNDPYHIFDRMTNERIKKKKQASAFNFVQTVITEIGREPVTEDNVHLVTISLVELHAFLMKIYNRYGKQLQVPLLTQLHVKLMTKLQSNTGVSSSDTSDTLNTLDNVVVQMNPNYENPMNLYAETKRTPQGHLLIDIIPGEPKSTFTA